MIKIKQCKGFKGENCCDSCKRRNVKAELLVKSLSIDKTCIHFVKDAGIINRPTKF